MAMHETTDVSVQPLVKFAVALFALIVVSMLGIWFMFHQLAAQENLEGPPASPLMKSRTPPPAPRLQTMETQKLDLANTRAVENEILSTYGWVDRKAGIVHIPIDRAIEILAQKGEKK